MCEPYDPSWYTKDSGFCMVFDDGLYEIRPGGKGLDIEEPGVWVRIGPHYGEGRWHLSRYTRLYQAADVAIGCLTAGEAFIKTKGST